MLTDTLAFTGVVLLLALVPGPSFALVLRQTVRGGRRLAFLTTLGNATGVAFWATSAVLGLSVLVTTSTLAYDVLRGCGAAALVVLGARSLRHAGRVPGAGGPPPDPSGRPGASVEPPRPDRPGRRALAGYRTGILVSLANPKAAVFAMTVLPQFVPHAASHLALRYLVLVAIWVLVSSAWYVVVSWVVSGARLVFGRMAVRRRLERVTGVLLIAFGVRLVAALR